MQLEIYKISHPIIQTIINKLDRYHNNELKYYNKYIGLLIIYEILRKYIKIQKLYIKKVRGIKEIDIIDKKNKYLILTDISKTYNMINEMEYIFNHAKIVHINYDNRKTIEYSIDNLKIDINNTYIFIIEKITEKEKVLGLIEYLEIIKKIPSDKISIGNIISNNKILEKIGTKYPKLKVYTTKIN
uniref:Uracil phosphoribosyltransferase n=1 Tax=Tolypiocladia glomerulata TaxID=860646 RepID=A0A1Z1MVE8_9FLOR|nr:uracil phosphoribosyltransferase [Tolypiocladia glomerulata]ARW69841.1 uracil phosphoribosyltransferase [Tolypiocladia glomerulata]